VQVELEGSGPLGVIVTAFVAAYGWRPSWKEIGRDTVAEFFECAWIICEPFLFGLIGIQIDFSYLTLEKLVHGMLVITCGLICRLVSTGFAVMGSGLSTKEQLFVSFVWVSKATVQAALASLILDHAVLANLGPDVVSYGTDILIVSILCILVTGPLGAGIIVLTGPKLLHCDAVVENNEQPSADDVTNSLDNIVNVADERTRIDL
jgi:NhaP-type Na+/H+ or K+/H+ antiporter